MLEAVTSLSLPIQWIVFWSRMIAVFNHPAQRLSRENRTANFEEQKDWDRNVTGSLNTDLLFFWNRTLKRGPVKKHRIGNKVLAILPWTKKRERERDNSWSVFPRKIELWVSSGNDAKRIGPVACLGYHLPADFQLFSVFQDPHHNHVFFSFVTLPNYCTLPVLNFFKKRKFIFFCTAGKSYLVTIWDSSRLIFCTANIYFNLFIVFFYHGT